MYKAHRANTLLSKHRIGRTKGAVLGFQRPLAPEPYPETIALAHLLQVEGWMVTPTAHGQVCEALQAGQGRTGDARLQLAVKKW